MSFNKKSRKENEFDELVVLGLGILEFDGNKYFGKSAVIKYLHEMRARIL